MSQAYRISVPAALAPFEYVALPMSVFWGVLFFGDWPDAVTYAGMVLVCGSGLYVLNHERAPRATLLGNIESDDVRRFGVKTGSLHVVARGHHRVSQLASRAIYGLSYRTPLEILANVKEEIDGNVGSLGMIVAFVGGRRRGA